MIKKHWITLFTLTFFLTLFTLQTTFAMTASANEELTHQPLEITIEDDYSVQSSLLPEKRDLGNGSGSITKMSSSQARSFVNSNSTTEHAFKQDFVGRNSVSSFDIYYNKKTGAVFLINKNQSTTISTGYYFIRP